MKVKYSGFLIGWVLCTLGFALAHADNLYEPQRFQAMVSDDRASRVGQTLTILIYEDAKASASAGTSTNKSADAGLGGKASIATGLLGVGTAGWESNEGYQGSGRIQRTGNLVAQISATIEGVDGNGVLLIKGSQLITVNGEKQEILIEGRVRPRDISSQNTVLSSRLADAKISYLGDGILANGQKPGWFTRLLSWLGLV